MCDSVVCYYSKSETNDELLVSENNFEISSVHLLSNNLVFFREFNTLFIDSDSLNRKLK